MALPSPVNELILPQPLRELILPRLFRLPPHEKAASGQNVNENEFCTVYLYLISLFAPFFPFINIFPIENGNNT